jgi:hypothetical protein
MMTITITISKGMVWMMFAGDHDNNNNNIEQGKEHEKEEGERR